MTTTYRRQTADDAELAQLGQGKGTVLVLDGTPYRRGAIADLRAEAARMEAGRLRIVTRSSEITVGNWAGPSHLFPAITVDQAHGVVRVTHHSVADKHAHGCTWEHAEIRSEDGQAVLVTGMCGLRNYKHPKCGGRQSFCFAIFRGDSGHIYTHRAPATKGWMTCPPDQITKRLRKLGIGADRGVVQQGDFLLKPSNGKALPAEEFKHEYMGSGHHKFEVPVLRTYARGKTYILLTEPVVIHHEAVDGIKHPAVTVPAGQYILGTTANSLTHPNARD